MPRKKRIKLKPLFLAASILFAIALFAYSIKPAIAKTPIYLTVLTDQGEQTILVGYTWQTWTIKTKSLTKTLSSTRQSLLLQWYPTNVLNEHPGVIQVDLPLDFQSLPDTVYAKTLIPGLKLPSKPLLYVTYLVNVYFQTANNKWLLDSGISSSIVLDSNTPKGIKTATFFMLFNETFSDYIRLKLDQVQYYFSQFGHPSSTPYPFQSVIDMTGAMQSKGIYPYPRDYYIVVRATPILDLYGIWWTSHLPISSQQEATSEFEVNIKTPSLTTPLTTTAPVTPTVYGTTVGGTPVIVYTLPPYTYTLTKTVTVTVNGTVTTFYPTTVTVPGGAGTLTGEGPNIPLPPIPFPPDFFPKAPNWNTVKWILIAIGVILGLAIFIAILVRLARWAKGGGGGYYRPYYRYYLLS